jgi:hypothetical protein
MPTSKTTKDDVVRYWERRQDEAGLSVDWKDASKRCWRCADEADLQKCHIIPKSVGGPDTPSNFVLLCFRCHRDAPNVPDPDFIWTWLRAYAVPSYGIYWLEAAMREFERIYKRKMFADLLSHPESGTSIDSCQQHLRAFANEEFAKVIPHYGEGILNASSMAWALAQVEKRVVNLIARASA